MLTELAERGWLPDPLIRAGIRRLLRKRLRQESADAGADPKAARQRFLNLLNSGPIAVETTAANAQHYEVSEAFFRQALGPRLKYSCCLWDKAASLAEAEEEMLEMTCRRAQLEDGMRVLDLGCGWGSLSLWVAEKFPNCRVTALSNSHSQKKFIDARCRELQLKNVEVVTANVAEFEPTESFDRVISIEMFEHVRNYEQLMAKIAHWLQPHGKLFVHIFCHRRFAYLFATDGKSDWMAKNFFTGGVMPSEDLLLEFQRDLAIEEKWSVAGTHYARTLECWLKNLDRHRERIVAETGWTDGLSANAVQRWRIFFMACAELFNFGGGAEWYVAHYRFARPEALEPNPSRAP